MAWAWHHSVCWCQEGTLSPEYHGAAGMKVQTFEAGVRVLNLLSV